MPTGKREGILLNIAMCNLRGAPAIRPKGHLISFLFGVMMVGDTIRSTVHGAYQTLVMSSREPGYIQMVKASSPSYRVD